MFKIREKVVLQSGRNGLINPGQSRPYNDATRRLKRCLSEPLRAIEMCCSIVVQKYIAPFSS